MGGQTAVPEIVEDYLAAIDSEAPNLVEALYLVGSVALNDYQPGRSDIDFIAVIKNGVSVTDYAAIRRAHARLRSFRQPAFDGSYLTWRELSQDPALSGRGPEVVNGKPRFPVAKARSPVAWQILARSGVPVRGPQPAELKVWTDSAGLHAWALRKLTEYWRPWHRGAATLWTPAGLACLRPAGSASGVLGISRLHHTLATGEIVSKTAAGQYAREQFGQLWQPIINECLRIRNGGPGPSEYRNVFARRTEALAFVAEVIRDAARYR